jgi:DNA-binding response OmpR family regulator
MRILVVEDSVRLRESIALGLKNAGYAVDSAADGRQGLWLAQSHSYDAIVLDIMLPSLDGIGVLNALRLSGRDTHVLLLTARDRLEDKIEGFRAGADDYLVKPFAFDELLARVGALVRRATGRKTTAVSVGACVFDQAARSLSRNGERIDLSPREFAVLEYLVARRGDVVSRTEIEAHIYDGTTDVMSNVVDSVVYALRKKLDAGGGESCIRTRRGAGYELLE